MSLRSFYITVGQALSVTIVVLVGLFVADAQVRTSPSYQLQSDSINFGGGLSSSTNYTQESTFGEIATGPSDSVSYSLKAGYQQLQEAFISIAGAAPVTLTPALGGLTGGISNGSTTVTVVTDAPAGYQLTIQADGAPALRSTDATIADYVPGAAPVADFNFITAAADVHFGFSPAGVDVVATYLDNGTTCGVGGLDTPLACWQGLSTSSQVIASGNANQPLGATTTVHFRVGIGGLTAVRSGTYIATTTLTAVAL